MKVVICECSQFQARALSGPTLISRTFDPPHILHDHIPESGASGGGVVVDKATQ